MRPQPVAIDRQIVPVIGFAEKAEEIRMVVEPLRRQRLQPVERDMRRVEIDRRDLLRIGAQIGQSIAAAAGDGDDMMARPDLQRFHVHDRVFPDLRIDQPAEQQRKGPLEQARPAGAILQDRIIQYRRLFNRTRLCAHGASPIIWMMDLPLGGSGDARVTGGLQD